MQASNCGNATINQNVTPPNAQVQFIQLPPQFTNMQVDCNTNVNALCATSLNVTDSTVVLDTTIPGQYTNLNDYNFLRSNKSIFPTFDNEFVITPTYAVTTFFGIATAISSDGSTLAIGATQSDPTLMASVDIYRRQGNLWIFAQHINRPLPYANGFGGSVALSYDGSILAVGSPDDSIRGNLAISTGCVALYTYNHSNNIYNLIQLIEGSSLSGFGSAVSLSATGQYLVISEGQKTAVGDANITYNPAFYVYARSSNCTTTCNPSNAWELEAYITATESDGTLVTSIFTGARTAFSSQLISISADGISIALGCPNRTDPSSGLVRGAVALFKRTGAQWRQTQFITSPNAASNDEFGASVALSGNGKYLATRQLSGGHVYIFEQHGSLYSLTVNFTSTNLVNTTGGLSFSHDGTTLVIGAGINPNFAGAPPPAGVFVAVRAPNNQWSVPYSLSRANSTYMGFAVGCSADGAFIVVGSPRDNSTVGTASVFRPVGSFIPNDTVVTGSLCVYHRTTIDGALKVAGNVHLNGTIVTGTAGNVTACTTILSDNRMKDNVAPLSAEEALAKLKALTPVSFEFVNQKNTQKNIGFIAPYFASNEATKGRQNECVGFIAQHVEHVFPQFVGNRPALESEAPLIHDGNTKTILIRAELYAYLIASLEKLVERNEQRKKELASIIN